MYFFQVRALHKQLQVGERAKCQAEDDLKALSQTYAQLKVRLSIQSVFASVIYDIFTFSKQVFNITLELHNRSKRHEKQKYNLSRDMRFPRI